jgi:transcription antitermination factor NusG
MSKKTGPQWFAVYTAPRAEKKVSERFTESGIEHYLPLQTVIRKWSDREKKVIVPVIHGYIFVRVSPLEFTDVLNIYGAIQFVREKFHPVPIPEEQIARLKFMVEGSDSPVAFTMDDIEPGIPVKIIRGEMQGLIGELVQRRGKHKIIIRIDKFGCAEVEVNLSSVEKL